MASTVVGAEYEVEAARWVRLRAQFSIGVHAKTEEGQVGLVLEGSEHPWKSAARLRLVHGLTRDIKLDVLTAASAGEIGEYEKQWEQRKSRTMRIFVNLQTGKVITVAVDGSAPPK